MIDITPSMTPGQRPRAPTRHDRNFHHQRPELVENSFARHLADGTLTEDDVTLLRTWIDEIAAQKQLSVSRVNKIAFQMVTWRRFIGPFRNQTPHQLGTISRLSFFVTCSTFFGTSVIHLFSSPVTAYTFDNFRRSPCGERCAESPARLIRFKIWQ